MLPLADRPRRAAYRLQIPSGRPRADPWGTSTRTSRPSRSGSNRASTSRPLQRVNHKMTSFLLFFSSANSDCREVWSNFSRLLSLVRHAPAKFREDFLRMIVSDAKMNEFVAHQTQNLATSRDFSSRLYGQEWGLDVC